MRFSQVLLGVTFLVGATTAQTPAYVAGEIALEKGNVNFFIHIQVHGSSSH